MSADLPPVLSANDVLRMAGNYLTRRAASTEQLRRYLLRKQRRHASESGARPGDAATLDPVGEEVLNRLGRAGRLADAAWASSRRSSLIAKGLPAKRVERTLRMQGLEPESREACAGETVGDEAQAHRYAERKRLGRFASGRRPPSRARDIRTLVRAGFAPDLAVRVMRDLMPDPIVLTDENDPASR